MSRPWARFAPRDLLALLFSAAFYAWLLLFTGGNQPLRELLDALFFIPPGLACAWLSFKTARAWAHDPQTRRAWLLIALSHFLIWCGGSVWTALLLVAPSVGHAQWTDALSMPAYPLAVWGMLSFPGIYRAGVSRARFMVDAGVMLVGCALGGWYFVYRPMGGDLFSAKALYLAITFPALDLAVLLLGFMSWQRAAQPSTRVALGWLVASKACIFAGDAIYGMIRLVDRYDPGHWVDGIWFAAWVFSWWAASRTVARATAVEKLRETVERTSVLPYALVLGAHGVLLFIMRTRLSSPAGRVTLASAAMGALLLARQLVELRENARLYQREREREARFRALVQHGTDVLLIVDAGGLILYRSPSAERLFDPSLPSLPGAAAKAPLTLRALFGAEAAASLEKLIGSLHPSPPRAPLPLQLARPDGRVLHFEFLANDLRHDRAVSGIVLTGRDVTERRAVEVERLHAQKMRAVGQLAGGVAHDFNNILTSLRGNVEMLLEDLPPAHAAHEDAAVIAQAVDRAARLTQQLLLFGRQEVVRPAALDLGEAAATLEPALRKLVGPLIELHLDRGPAPAPVFIDRGQLEQVFLNLVVNARDAMKAGGALRLSVRPAPGDRLALEVQDSGDGMDAATRARMFEPFFTTKPQGEGTGLGLATVQAIVLGAGGSIECLSAKGQGTTFTVLLPRSRAGVELATPRPDQARGASSSACVLVVDDEAAVLRVTARMLERRGFRVLQARSGEEALEVLASHQGPVELVLTDLMMPGLGGAALIARLAEESPRLPVVCMSGHAADESSRRQAATGASAFLQKPFTPHELSLAVTSALVAGR